MDIHVMNLLKSLIVVSSITIFSRMFGFARDVIIAKVFGVEITTDAFFIAFRLPNLLRRIFAEGVFSQTFIPILAEYKSKQNEQTTRILISYMSGLLILVLAVITLLGIIAAPWVVIVTAPGFATNANIDKFILTIQLLRITFPYIFLISLVSLAGAILNTWYCFSTSAFTPIFLNITMISFTLFIAPYFNPPILALAWSVIVGGISQLIYQLLCLKKINMLVLPRINLRNMIAIKVIKHMVPGFFCVSVSQLSSIINTIFASFLVSGSMSWMYYADRMMEFPAGILGVTLSTILLPALAKSFINGNNNEYCCLIDWGLRLCFLLALPSAVSLWILAKPLVISLFQYGKFTAIDVLMTYKALIAYSIGLVGLIIAKVLASSFYSRQDFKTPIIIAIITLILTQLMNFAFIGPLKHIGLSLSISFAAIINSAMLYWQLRKQNIYRPQSNWKYFLLRLFIAVLVMAITLVSILYFMPDWTVGAMFYRLLRLLPILLAGSIVYFGMLAILGFKIKEFAGCIISLTTQEKLPIIT